jgi:hypothetical protein
MTMITNSSSVPILPACVTNCQHIAKRIYTHLIGKGLDFFKDNGAHLALISRNGNSIREPLGIL